MAYKVTVVDYKIDKQRKCVWIKALRTNKDRYVYRFPTTCPEQIETLSRLIKKSYPQKSFKTWGEALKTFAGQTKIYAPAHHYLTYVNEKIVTL